MEVYKAYHSYDPQYLSGMFKKQRDEYNTRNDKALVQHKCNSTTYGLHSFKNEGARMWNKSDMSFRSAGSAQQFKDFLNGMEDEVCECNNFNYILCMLQRF